ncbi:GH1 family beta-glucosidase [Hyphomonas chukchiensis]|uniref:GH1 family beta-glucosidase n=1 Tax=Hyphomonas chukchiensis TaxID=1280947 RepID=UPI0030FB406D
MVKPGDFPKDFIWGASTASYQIEGAHDEDGRALSIWDAFCREPGRIDNGDTGDVACDHYHRYREDVGLMRQLGLDAYRFSFSWSRVLPEGKGQPNEAGLDFYDRLTDSLLENGIAPWACLYHWDLPLALHEAGKGWTSREIAPLFADYATLMADRLGDRITHWATFNEPNVFAMFGYKMGIHAPGIRDYDLYRDMVHGVNLAHGAAIQALRDSLPAGAQLGVVPNMQPCLPRHDTDPDHLAAARLDAWWNRAFADPMILGKYDPIVSAALGDRIRPGDEKLINQKLDWFGLNHYSPLYATADDGPAGYRWANPPEDSEITLMGWNASPEGFRDILIETAERYGLPIFVTENGVADLAEPDAKGSVKDDVRIDFIDRYLAALLEVRAAGADVRGYFVWSLLDNFEWAKGYTTRFGVTHVDFETLKRTPKDSFHWLAGLTGKQA